jgi:2-polyprenyl-3-methyl-5-hydroxy-6-metoxy-1,4-benzoquinol methylase
MAGAVLPAGMERYQIDLMNLGWRERWDVAFLLDIIEHLRDDAGALREAARALKPGGLLFVTTPALARFWSYNDGNRSTSPSSLPDDPALETACT